MPPKTAQGLRRFGADDPRRHASITGTFVERTLTLICENGPYRNAVFLAADLWPASPNSALPYPFVEQAIIELNELGYVVYSEGEDFVPIRIRATKDGYDAAGMPPPIRVIGRHDYPHLADQQPNHYDYTNFFYHSGVAKGDVIEHLPISEHHPHHDVCILMEVPMSMTATHKQIQSEINRGRPDGLPQMLIDRIAPMLREGKGDREIVAALGVSREKVRKVASAIGLKRRRGTKPAGWTPEFVRPNGHAPLDGKAAEHERMRQAGIPVAVIPAPAPPEPEPPAVVPPVPVPVAVDAATAVPAPVAAVGRLTYDKQPVTPTRYPLIAALLERETNIRIAVGRLRDAGLPELADMAEAQINDLTPLEREVLDILKGDR